MPDFVWFENVVLPILAMGMGTLFMVGLYRTVNRVLDRRHEVRMRAAGGPVPEEVGHLEERVAALESQVERVRELEERLDFAERMLAQQRQQPLLGDH
jgi:hypothetical protein